MKTRLTIILTILSISCFAQIKRQTGTTVSDESLQVNYLLNIPRLGSSGPAFKEKGTFWIDTVANVLKYYNGSTNQTLALSGSGVTSLTGTANQINVSASTGAVILSLPQPIGTTSSPTFNAPTVKKLWVNGAAGTTRDITYQSGGVDRWILRTNATYEAGSNTGSPFEILARADDASNIGIALALDRATRLLSLPAYSTGLLHTDASGNVTSSTVATSDIANGAVTVAKADTGSTGLATNLRVNNLQNQTNSKQAQLNGTGFVKANGTIISYDNTTYTPTNGTGASGTWGINISGNAATVTNGAYTNVANTFTADQAINGLLTIDKNLDGVSLPSNTTPSGRTHIGNNLSGSKAEMNFINEMGYGGSPIGGVEWGQITPSGVYEPLGRINGDTKNFESVGRIKQGIIDASIASDNKFVQIDQVNGQFVSRTKAEVQADLGILSTEGTWTPTASTATTSATGRYTKMGNTVMARFSITVDVNASSTPFTISGLPFANSSNSRGSVTINLTDVGLPILGGVGLGSSAAAFFDFSGVNITCAQMSGKTLSGSISYSVSN